MHNEWPNFDELLKLARSAPEKLEAFRLKEVDRIIAGTPKEMQHRLKGLQFQVDCRRRLQKNSMASCIAISEMMHESLLKLNATLNNKPLAAANRPQEARPKILPFKTPALA